MIKIYLTIFFIFFILTLIKKNIHVKSNFRKNGFFTVKNVIDPKLCKKIYQKIIKDSNIDPKIKYNKRINRILDFDNIYKKAFSIVYNKIKNHLSEYFNNKEIKLYEFYSIITYPNTFEQHWHRFANKPYLKNNEMISVALLLTDLEKNRAPVQLYKGSHLISKVKSNTIIDLTGKKGDVIMWDTFSIHKHSNNISQNKNCLLIFSFLNKSSIEASNKKLNNSLKKIYNNISINDIL